MRVGKAPTSLKAKNGGMNGKTPQMGSFPNAGKLGAYKVEMSLLILESLCCLSFFPKLPLARAHAELSKPCANAIVRESLQDNASILTMV